jgi:hypothetical protein
MERGKRRHRQALEPSGPFDVAGPATLGCDARDLQGNPHLSVITRPDSQAPVDGRAHLSIGSDHTIHLPISFDHKNRTIQA